MKMTPREKEWNRLLKQERMFITEGLSKKDSKLNQILAERVPEKLQGTLDTAFSKAFETIFDKGTGVIEMTFSKEIAEEKYNMQSFAADRRESRKNLRRFKKTSEASKNKNLILTSIEGLGLGALGIGLPDIPVFVGMLLKGIYEIAISFGYTYDTPEEKYFILKLIETALSYGWDLRDGDVELNKFIETETLPEDYSMSKQIKAASKTMSKELLYLKFLQGMPVVGAVGGAYNTIYMHKVLKYAKLKYHRRFLTEKEQDAGGFDPDDAC